MPERRIVHYSGQVQGVGFRFRTAILARRFPIAGYVCNLSDGRVQMVAEGQPEVLEEFTAALADEMAGYIRETQMSSEPATGEFGDFEIRY